MNIRLTRGAPAAKTPLHGDRTFFFSGVMANSASSTSNPDVSATWKASGRFRSLPSLFFSFFLAIGVKRKQIIGATLEAASMGVATLFVSPLESALIVAAIALANWMLTPTTTSGCLDRSQFGGTEMDTALASSWATL